MTRGQRRYTNSMRFVVLLATLLLPLTVGAQSFPGLGSVGSSFTLSVAPQYPAPYGEALVTPSSGSIDLARATLTATAGGKEIYKGSIRSFSVPLGKAGSVVNVKATVTIGGASYVQTVAIVPQDVALIVEPVARQQTPAFLPLVGTFFKKLVIKPYKAKSIVWDIKFGEHDDVFDNPAKLFGHDELDLTEEVSVDLFQYNRDWSYNERASPLSSASTRSLDKTAFTFFFVPRLCFSAPCSCFFTIILE